MIKNQEQAHRARLNKHVELKFATTGHTSNFYGYHTTCPMDSTDSRLLAHQTDFDGRNISAVDTSKVGYWNIHSNTYTQIGETGAFNWQQGSMLQWLPPDYSRYIIYNDRCEDYFVSKIHDIQTSTDRVIPYPIYAVHPSGRFALAVNYKRLYFFRPGYNYQGIVDETWNHPLPKEDGIFRVDLVTGATQLLVPLEDVARNLSGNLSAHVAHWLEHIIWNPSGTRFAFLHRWQSQLYEFETRLYTADADGSNLHMFPDVRSYSHMAWRNDHAFTIWCTIPNAEPSIMQQLHREAIGGRSISLNAMLFSYRWLKQHVIGDSLARRYAVSEGYVEFQDEGSNVWERYTHKGLHENGHNMWHPTRQLMLTDTYADAKGYRSLLLYNPLNDSVQNIGRFFSPFNNVGYRCDLHPRWNRGGDAIILDSAHRNNERQIYLFAVTDLIAQ